MCSQTSGKLTSQKHLAAEQEARREESSDREDAPQKAPAEWVEGLVQQMSGARDLGDARARAANELRSFERAVMQATDKVFTFTTCILYPHTMPRRPSG